MAKKNVNYQSIISALLKMPGDLPCSEVTRGNMLGSARSKNQSSFIRRNNAVKCRIHDRIDREQAESESK